jgi:hypothetical protein
MRLFTTLPVASYENCQAVVAAGVAVSVSMMSRFRRS